MGKWLDDIIIAMQNLGGHATYANLYDEIARIRKEKLPRTWQAIVRNQIESYSSDSDNYRSRRKNIFRSIGGLGSGIWALRENEHQAPQNEFNISNPSFETEVSSVNESVVGYEGSLVTFTTNRYERDQNLRQRCIEHWGSDCVVCGLNFRQIYGDIGRGYIHVHHLEPLALRPGPRIVDPIRDLRPVCPNCHAMIHKKSPPIPVEELRQIVLNSHS